ncbi:DUF4012 domain-containing protein [Candidatus Daviesbacteria bacterium]|nr:DUF4012 domain-containing protein [Candidatus Daviesbacteria bacterium]
MNETPESINTKHSILLSRNNPVALVVGAAGFLGSHLVDKLLDQGIQVVGVDDLRYGEKFNLRKATENRNFHLVIESPEKLDLDLPRLDYVFILPGEETNLGKILEQFRKEKSRCLLVSSIDLYEKGDLEKSLEWLKEAESRIAKFAREHNLNARVLRLGPVYGPRMDFKPKDPVIKLITQALNGNLQKQVSLEFSSRALYIADAIDLMIRTIFAGSTAQKIFDGVLPTPVKVSEIKQVLLDPVWYEEKDFVFSELPPWPTPNLDKTIKTLNWRPKSHILANLKKTLSYFRDNEIKVLEEMEDEKLTEEKQPDILGEEKRAALEAFRQKAPEESKEKLKVEKKRKIPGLTFPKIYLICIFALVTYALVWPGLILSWSIFSFHYQLNDGFKNLSKGEFEKSLGNIKQAEAGVREAKSIFGSLEPIRKTGLLKQQFELSDNLLDLSTLSISAVRSSVLGIQALLKSLQAVTGEKDESAVSYFNSAQVDLSSAGENFAKAETILKDENFNRKLPGFLQKRVDEVSLKLSRYAKLAAKTEAMSVLLPQLVGLNGAKNYLVLLQNNMELRPTGGFIGSFAEISFEGGKLKKMEVNDIYAIDGQLNIHVEPPAEIKEDLGQKDFYLRDSNWEPDFPTSARQAEWFYTKETGKSVEGVVALDVSAMEELLTAIGEVELADYKEKINPENLFEKAVTHAETGFFPGTQAKKSFLTALTHGVFEKIFYLPQNNWPAILTALGKSLEEKHISLYLNDPKPFSYLVSQNWTHVLPRQSNENQNKDFLSLVEANLGANKVNYYLDRSYDLHTVVEKDGNLKHRLRVSFLNRSPSDAFPGGKYKNRMRIYLPFGSKLNRAIWGETEITGSASSFVDYGRSGYSFLLELNPKEQKILVLDYEVPMKLEFQDDKATYRLDVVKQAGTGKDPFVWTITYPINYQLISNQVKASSPQEQSISTDLSVDRSFEVEFKK